MGEGLQYAPDKGEMNGGTDAEQLERVLSLAAVARGAETGPQWKTDSERAIEAHGEACAALWAELYRLLDNRLAAGDPVHKPRLPPDPRKELRSLIVKRLREELPSMVASIIDDL